MHLLLAVTLQALSLTLTHPFPCPHPSVPISLTIQHCHSVTHMLSHARACSLAHALITRSRTLAHSHPRTLAPLHSRTHEHSHSRTHSRSLYFTRCLTRSRTHARTISQAPTHHDHLTTLPSKLLAPVARRSEHKANRSAAPAAPRVGEQRRLKACRRTPS